MSSVSCLQDLLEAPERTEVETSPLNFVVTVDSAGNLYVFERFFAKVQRTFRSGA